MTRLPSQAEPSTHPTPCSNSNHQNQQPNFNRLQTYRDYSHPLPASSAVSSSDPPRSIRSSHRDNRANLDLSRRFLRCELSTRPLPRADNTARNPLQTRFVVRRAVARTEGELPGKTAKRTALLGSRESRRELLRRDRRILCEGLGASVSIRGEGVASFFSPIRTGSKSGNMVATSTPLPSIGVPEATEGGSSGKSTKGSRTKKRNSKLSSSVVRCKTLSFLNTSIRMDS